MPIPPSVFDAFIDDPYASGQFENLGTQGLPEDIYAELLRVAADKSVSVYYLAAIYKRGRSDALLQSSEGLHEKKDHCAGLAAVGNDTGRSTTEAASDVVTVSREAAEDALQYAWNAGVAGAWKCVREMFADGRDVRGWAISVEKHSAPVAANWQQARDLLFGSASSSISEASTNNAQERSAEKP
jgi:hypothetical protein